MVVLLAQAGQHAVAAEATGSVHVPLAPLFAQSLHGSLCSWGVDLRQWGKPGGLDKSGTVLPLSDMFGVLSASVSPEDINGRWVALHTSSLTSPGKVFLLRVQS
jgi:hypothetical protein